MTVFWQDDFEGTGPNLGGGDREATGHPNTDDGTPPDANNNGNYFFRTTVTQDVNSGQQTNFSNIQGANYWRAEDVEDAGADNLGDFLNWTGIDISGQSNLSFLGLFGAGVGNQAGQGNVTYENGDAFRVEYQVDSGNWQTGIQFVGTGVANDPLFLDENRNGVRDGGENTSISAALAEFTFNIAETGNTLNLRYHYDMYGSGSSGASEETAIDNFRLDGTAASATYSIAVNPAEGNEDGPTVFTYTITRTETTGAATVDVGFSGTGTLGSDYSVSGLNVSNQASFADGAATATFSVTSVRDATPEPDETVIATLSNPSSGMVSGPNGSATATILNDDPANFSIAVAPASGDEGSTTFTYTVTRDAAGGAETVDVDFGGTSDRAGYTVNGLNPNGQLEFANGALTATFTVTPVNDANPEPDETVIATISNPSDGSAVTTASATATIVNDDNGARFVFWQDNFEGTGPNLGGGDRDAPAHASRDNGTGPSQPDDVGDYFFRTNQANPVPSVGLDETFTGFEGDFLWRLEDPEDSAGQTGNLQLGILNWTGIDITGQSDISFSGLFGGRTFDTANFNYETTDFLTLSAQVDGGGFADLLSFRGTGVQNAEMAQDSDLNGVINGNDNGNTLSPLTRQGHWPHHSPGAL